MILKTMKKKIRIRFLPSTREAAPSYAKNGWLFHGKILPSYFFSLSLIIIAFKMSVYRNFVQEMGHSLKSVNKERLEEFTFLLFLLVFIAAWVVITIPVILMLRAFLTSQLKKRSSSWKN
uniref:hypothetical protein n=1 Tax=Candidatus Bartonella washoeensis TaxID=186739 RepID=UPI0018FE41C8|nr:hypothetical protein [Bartonella washoeensis]